MAAGAVAPPEGFVLDQAPATSDGLPEGFVLDQKPGPNKAVLGARGFNDSVAETLGAIPDAAAWALRPLGLAPQEKGYYTNRLKEGIAALGGPGKEDAKTGLDKFIYGAGHGVGDAASVFMPATAVANTAKAGSMSAEIAKALAAQPITQAASGAMGEGTSEGTGSQIAGIGAAMATPLAMNAASRLISPGMNALNSEQQRLAELLKNEGVNLTPGQQTGSKPIQTLESVLDNLPFSSGMSATEKAGQNAAFNKAVLSRAGISAEAATPDVLNTAKTRLGNEFERISQATTVNLDKNFLSDLQGVVSQYGQKLPSQQKEVFNSYVSDILNTGNQMPGTTYQITRSDLGRYAKSIVNTDPRLSNALNGLKSALDSAFNRSAPSAMQDALGSANSQYGNLKTILKAAAAQGEMGASGNIAPAQLYSAARNAVGTDRFATGKGDLNDLARAGEVFLKGNVPNSGTAQRSLWQNLLTHTPGAIVGGAGAGAIANPASIPAIIAALSTPPAVKAAMQSRLGTAYLTNQLGTAMAPNVNRQLLAAQLMAVGKRPALQAVTGSD